MSGFASMVTMRNLAGASLVAAGLFCASSLGAQENQDELSLRTFPTYWLQDRTKQDDFLPPASGFGPVTSELGHPYVPNGEGRQQTSRIADLSNPILKPWVIEQMAKPNTDVRAGRIPDFGANLVY